MLRTVDGDELRGGASIWLGSVVANGWQVLACRCSQYIRTSGRRSGILLECLHARQFCQPCIVEVVVFLVTGPSVRAAVRWISTEDSLAFVLS